MINLDRLESLVMAYAPSGHEEPVKEVWMNLVRDNAFRVDNVPGFNCYALSGERVAERPLIYLSAHGDEVGFVVTFVSDEGFIHFAPLDNNILDITSVRAKKVVIRHGANMVTGVIGHSPSHCLPSWGADRRVDWENLWIDIGARDRDEALTMIAIGDPISFKRDFDVIGNGRVITSGALDNRVSCSVVVEVFNRLARTLTRCDLIAGLHVQEEVDQRGGLMAAQYWKPDYNIVVDMMFAFDHPEVSAKTIGKVDLGKGPVITWNGCLDRRLTQMLKETAIENKIPFQEIAWAGKLATDAFHMSKVGHGVPTVNLYIPLRYMHTNVEVVEVSDIEKCVELLERFVRRLEGNG